MEKRFERLLHSQIRAGINSKNRAGLPFFTVYLQGLIKIYHAKIVFETIKQNINFNTRPPQNVFKGL